MNVILHEDHSTPTVSVNIWYHVGSAYEKVGHTGFAHLFEHLMFEGSGHVAEGDFDKFLETVGGDNNAASYNDVAEFFKTYYVPNNASLVIAGDINPNETLKLVDKWFGSIQAGKPVPPLNPESSNLNEEKIVTIEDNVQLPRLYMVWVTPPFFDPGDTDMDILSSIFTQGKNSRLYNKLVYEM